MGCSCSLNEDFSGNGAPVANNVTKMILSQLEKCVCKIYKINGKKGTGFLCNLPFPDQFHLLPVLITNNHVLNNEDLELNKNIKISFNDDKVTKIIKINEDRKTFTSKDIDITIIEIIPNVDNLNNFLDIDKDFVESVDIHNCKEEQVYIMQYPRGENSCHSIGLLKSIEGKNIYHYCSTDFGSSGSPILRISNYKIIGVHNARSHFKFNKGIFIKNVIEEFNKKYESNLDNKNYNKYNDLHNNININDMLPINSNNDNKETKENIISLDNGLCINNNKNINNMNNNYNLNHNNIPENLNMMNYNNNLNNNINENEPQLIQNNIDNNLNTMNNNSNMTYVNHNMLDRIRAFNELNSNLNDIVLQDNSMNKQITEDEILKYFINYNEMSNMPFNNNQISNMPFNNNEMSNMPFNNNQLPNIPNNISLNNNDISNIPINNNDILNIPTNNKDISNNAINNDEKLNIPNNNIPANNNEISNMSLNNNLNLKNADILNDFALKDYNPFQLNEYTLKLHYFINNINQVNIKNMKINNDVLGPFKDPILNGLFYKFENNKIILIIKINDDQSDSYIFGNPEYPDENYFNIKHFDETVKELNESNTKLFISDNETNFKKKIHLNKGIYEIKIVINNYIMRDCIKMFFQCNDIMNIDLSSFYSSNVNDMSYMFALLSNNFNKLTNIELSSFDTQNVTNMEKMFYNCCKLNNLDLSSFNTEKVINMKGMFFGCSKIKTLNLSSFNTSNVISMNEMFFGCKNLIELNISKFNTNKVNYMVQMFAYCNNLITLDLSSFDTINVKNTSGMFQECKSLQKINISSFNTSSVTDMNKMFFGCHNLEEINLSNFDTKNVTNMNEMFCFCYNLKELNLSSFDTKNVLCMNHMFNQDKNLKNLNISNFNFSKVQNVRSWFAKNIFSNEPYKLEEIIVSGNNNYNFIQSLLQSDGINAQIKMLNN